MAQAHQPWISRRSGGRKEERQIWVKIPVSSPCTLQKHIAERSKYSPAAKPSPCRFLILFQWQPDIFRLILLYNGVIRSGLVPCGYQY